MVQSMAIRTEKKPVEYKIKIIHQKTKPTKHMRETRCSIDDVFS